MKNEEVKSAFWVGFVVGFIAFAILGFVVTHFCLDRVEECKTLDGVKVCRTITYGNWETKTSE